MSKLTLTLADFKEQLPFSAAIETRQINPFIQFSYTLDILPILGFAPLEEIELLPATPITEFSTTATIVADDLVTRRERVYKALVGAPTGTPPGAEWRYEPLHTLWFHYLKRYWIQASFGRFLAQHGLDITKAGVTAPTDPNGTFTRPASADKAALQASIDTVTEALRARLTAFLHGETQAYSTDKTTGYDYGIAHQGCHARSSQRTRLRGINRRR